MNPLERRIFAIASDPDPTADQKRILRITLTRVPKKDRLIETAVREGVAALVYHTLRTHSLLDRFTPAQQRRMGRLYLHTLSANVKRLHDLQQLLGTLHAHGIPVVLMQGVSLIGEAYGDAGLRPLTDIDLWIPETHRSRASDALIQMGYRPERDYPDTFKRGATLVDLHTHILWAERIRSREQILARPQQALWDAAQSIAVAGTTALRLNRYDQIIFLALHTLKHRARRLIWLVDIRRLVSGWSASDWRAAVARAKHLDQEKNVAVILRLLRDMLGFPLPEPVLTLMQPGRFSLVDRLAIRSRLRGDAMPAWAPIWFMSSGTQAGKRRSMITESLFPRPAIMRQIFRASPHLSDRQLYIKRVFQLMGRLMGRM